MIFTDMTSAPVASLLFEDWNFDEPFIIAMKYMDKIKEAPEDVKSYINALNVVRKAVNINNQLTDESIEAAADLVEKLELNKERFIKTAKPLEES